MARRKKTITTEHELQFTLQDLSAAFAPKNYPINVYIHTEYADGTANRQPFANLGRSLVFTWTESEIVEDAEDGGVNEEA